MAKLAGRVALVTGCSRAIGAAIARLFAEEGAPCDFQQIEAIRGSIESELGPVDLLVANAAATSRRGVRWRRCPRMAGEPRSRAT